ncbi:hypothetical protein COV18_02300 [Candidatus Woesearchaeota archaeon CG10_big_fil_rev_8_21_14_0_10_37_12]|nr:MAG: hypothetical protein COV18_02300 [Candidatus Woesearchaeota archaeon CG10_big_fil_rev_8_21_14_0_10_37_12]
MNKKWIFLFILTSCITGFVTGIPEETGSIDVFFCDKVNCNIILQDKIAQSSKANCAMYNPSKELINELNGKGFLATDEEYASSNTINEFGSGLMHNKFCLFDNQFVWTGSWNPKQEMSIPNNVVLIESKIIASAFTKEFEEFEKGVFHGGKSLPGLVKLNGSLIEAYFCPEDNCQERVLETLETAEDSIYFMTYSFTNDEIGDLVLDKSKKLVVKGIFDPRKDKKYSEYEKLKDFSKIEKVHHKVFIVDEKIVITGSYNPTNNGNTRNDENVVIIHNKEIAGKFVDEFNSLW